MRVWNNILRNLCTRLVQFARSCVVFRCGSLKEFLVVGYLFSINRSSPYSFFLVRNGIRCFTFVRVIGMRLNFLTLSKEDIFRKVCGTREVYARTFDSEQRLFQVICMSLEIGMAGRNRGGGVFHE